MKKLLTIAICLCALPAAAHPGHGDVAGFAAGLAHPFTGLDHLLAMLGVGLWSRQQRSIAMPIGFLLMMALGASVQLALPMLETGVAATVALLGFLIVAAPRLPAGAALGATALFAFLHGQAHGLELPGTASAAGFLLASAALLAAGASIGAARIGRVAGAAIGAAGLCLLAVA